MVVIEKRPPLRFRLDAGAWVTPDSVEFRVKGIGQFPRRRFAPRSHNGPRARIEWLAIAFDELLPGSLKAFAASTSQPQIFQIKRGEISFEFLWFRPAIWESPPSTAFERPRKSSRRQPPTLDPGQGTQAPG